MKVQRIVANVGAVDPALAEKFYGEILGLDLLMDMDWIRTYGSKTKMSVQVSFMSEGGSGTPVPDLSIEVDDLDIAFSKFKDDGISIDDNDPSKRWIARYEREADRPSSDPSTRTFGSFGLNENGLQDVGGNVWEWTASCFMRRVLDDDGTIISESPNCGVRVVEGQHRAYVTDFIRDAKAGGCAVGVPPDNLGFRLVLEPKWPSAWRLIARAAAR